MAEDKEIIEELTDEAKDAVEAAAEELADEAEEVIEAAAEELAEEAEEAVEPLSDMILSDDSEELEQITEELGIVEDEPAKKVKASTVIHWTVHVIMAAIIAVMCYLMFSDTGKLMQTYGFDEANQITSTYKNHDWASVGIDMDSYAYYYDMYNEYFATYESEYKEMGINNMSELMDAMYDSMVSYYSVDTTSTTN